MSLCKHKDIFGEPREGSHELRDPVFDTALVDTGITLIVCYAISKYYNYSFMVVFFILMIIAIIAHRSFCVRTTVDKFLFP
jgi:hypothetical protein